MSSMTPFDQHLNTMIMERINANEKAITKRDANKIVRAIIPELDKLISEKVKEHFCSLAYHILEKINSKE